MMRGIATLCNNRRAVIPTVWLFFNAWRDWSGTSMPCTRPPGRCQISNASATPTQHIHRSRLQLSKCIPGSLESVLNWPVIQEYSLTAKTCSPFSNHNRATIWDRSSSFSLMEDLRLASCAPWLDNFFNDVHIKNPVLDEKFARALVRRICVDGPGWDNRSLLALLICANGALIRPFLERSILQHELDSSVVMSLYSAAQKRFSTLFMSGGIVEAQCALFAGIFLVSILRPIDAWRMFLQGLAICQGFNQESHSAEEESIYWSCWKSEQELRVVLRLT
ncbi:hypothetical protein IQ07DRAFT_337677 [Pyrenochaeta sp. DS3sAY3a]|nr:hypothetical protein IQ07DRAFT_337677 [Pyrenochaeta sp. DS3sAY3a]